MYVTEGSEISITKCDTGQFCVAVEAQGESFSFNITPKALQEALLGAVEYAARNVGPNQAQLKLIRAPGHFLKTLSDISIQYFMRHRSLDSDQLVRFLWFLDDAEVTEKILRNCSSRAAFLLRDDLKALGPSYPECAAFSIEEAKKCIASVNEALTEVLKTFEE